MHRIMCHVPYAQIIQLYLWSMCLEECTHDTQSTHGQTPTTPRASPASTPGTPTLNGSIRVPTSYPVLSPSFVQPAVPAVNGPYSVQLQLVGIPSSDAVLFTNAKYKWESVITSDMSDQTTSNLQSVGAGCTYPTIIDDLYICASYRSIDGPKNVVGIAGPNYNRDGNIAFVGSMEFDKADIANLKATGSFTDTVLHEMGHVMGIGTNWDDKGLISEANTQCPYSGTNANREYKAVSGCKVVPLETEEGKGPCSHWDEECLVDELMTGVIVERSKPILSRITLGTLADLGYSVDYSKADAYTKSNLGPGCTCTSRTGERSTRDTSHGETIQFGLRGNNGNNNNNTTYQQRRRRRLSDATHQFAIEFGQRMLEQRALSTTDRNLLNSDVVYVGDQVVSILVQEDDDVYGVIVRRKA